MDKVKHHTSKRARELKGIAEQWKDRYLRALADYQNLEKRKYEEENKVRHILAEEILEDLLPVLDTFERAYRHLQDEGLRLGLKEFYEYLEKQGVKKNKTLEKEFDPNIMECVEVVEGKHNIVVEEVLPGYMLGERVLRVAHVKVGKGEDKTKIENSDTRIDNKAVKQ